jgi:hypothetical protein
VRFVGDMKQYGVEEATDVSDASGIRMLAVHCEAAAALRVNR